MLLSPKKEKLLRSAISWLAVFSLLLNTLSGAFFAAPYAFAQEETSTPEPTATPTAEPTLEPSSEPTQEPESTTAPDASPSPTPTLEAFPTPEATITPTTEPEITSEPVVLAGTNTSGGDPLIEETPESEPSAELVFTLSTDKADYSPTDTVTITGADFPRNSDLTIRVTWPDGLVRDAEGNVGSSDTVTTDENGSFVYLYPLRGEGQAGEYLVEALMGTAVLATTTFTDNPDTLPSSVQLRQWKTLPSGNWITGNLGSSNSDYSEGEVVPFQLDVGGVPAGTYDFSVCRDYEDGVKKGYLNLQTFNTSRAASPGGTITSTIGSFDGVSVTINSVTEVGGQGACSSGERETEVSITTTGAATAYVLWGGYLASPIDPGVDSGNGAASFPGSSLHMGLLSASKDRSINPSAIIELATIIVQKVVDSGTATPDQWCFNIDPNPNGEALPKCPAPNTDSVTFLSLPTGDYTITETTVAGYSFASGTGSSLNCTFSDSTATASVTAGTPATDATCVFHNAQDTGTLTVNKILVPSDDSGLFNLEIDGTSYASDVGDGGTTGEITVTTGAHVVSETAGTGTNLSDYIVTVDGDCDSSGNVTVGLGENKTCTITNTKKGKIIVEKQTDPAESGQSFNFTASYDGDGFSLTDNQTNDSGYLSPGVYSVSETVPDGWDLTSPTCSDESDPSSIDLSAGEIVTCTFTNTQRGSISGHKYHDKNANELFDGSDVYLDDWTINLSGDATGSAETGFESWPDGYYEFTNLVPGEYTICEELQGGWTQITPDPGTNSGCYVEAVGPGQDVTNRDFGNFQNIKISGYKFEDLNGNGIWDLGEPTLNDWTINLGGTATDSAVTGFDDWEDGYYEFVDLGPGDYTVSETLLSSDWFQTAGDDPYLITAVGGQDVSNFNFGNFEFATVWGFKYNDLDADGDISDDVEPLDEWEINLTGQTSVITGSGSWDPGYYEFTGLTAGGYTLSETLQLGWTQSFPGGDGTYPFTIQSGDVLQFDFANWTTGELIACKKDEVESPVFGWDMSVSGGDLGSPVTQATGGDGCTTFDLNPGTYTVTEEDKSDWIHVSPADGVFDNVVVESNQTTFVNFFNERKASLTIVKFNDLNGNTLDDSEPRLEGWHFTVYEESCEAPGDPVLSGDTDSSGELSGLLEAGTYCLVEDDSSHPGWVNTTPLEVEVSLSPDEQETVYFGNQGQGSIIIIKEVVPPDESLWLFEIFGGPELFFDDPSLGDGQEAVYNGLAVGSYEIAEEPGEGYTTTYDCGSKGSGQGGFVAFDLETGDEVICTFTNTRDTGEIVVTKLVDEDGDPETTTDQTPASGWEFDINGTGENTDDPGPVTTDETGSTSAVEVSTGEYEVVENIQENWIVIDAYCDAGENGAFVPPDTIEEINVGSGQTVECTFVNFLPQPGISSLKTRISAEEILVGDTATFEIEIENTGNVTLYTPEVEDLFDTDYMDFDSSSPISPSIVTEIAGFDFFDYDGDGDISELFGNLVWELPDLAPGEIYTITLNFTATAFTLEPDVLATNGAFVFRACVDLECDEEIETDFSFAYVDIDALGEVEGYKFHDLDGDGEWGGEEGTLAGWTIKLFEYDEGLGNEVDSTLTDEEGFYSFENLSAGTYAVCEVLPEDWAQTSPVEGEGVVLTEFGTCYIIVITEDGDIYEERNFGNLEIILGLLLEKSNDHESGASGGDTVTYTLVVTITEDANWPADVTVVDALPGGFTYVAGSATVNGTPQEPVISGGTLSWDVGTMGPEGTESVTIIYQATIATDISPGTYTNLATCSGTGSFVECNENEEGEGIPVSSSVPIGVPLALSASVGGQVLGAATELPAAGAETVIVVTFLLLILAGLALRLSGHALKKGWLTQYFAKKTLKQLLPVALLLPFLLWAAVTPAKAVVDTVDISDLPTYRNTDTFKLSYSALSDDPITAQFYLIKDGHATWRTLGPVLNGSSGQVQVSGSDIYDGDGLYHFKVEINGGAATDQTSTTIDRSGPSPVQEYRREQIAPGFYRLFWKNPGDSDFNRVLIYRSTEPQFTADDSTRVGEVGGAPDAQMSWDNFGLDPNQSYFYALRAVDNAGNGSSIVADPETTIVIPGPTVQAAATAAAEGEVTALPEEGEILGEEEALGASPSPTPAEAAGGLLSQIGGLGGLPLGTIALGLVILVVLGFLFWWLLR